MRPVVHAIHAPDDTLALHAVVVPIVGTLMGSTELTLPDCRINRLTIQAEKRRARVNSKSHCCPRNAHCSSRRSPTKTSEPMDMASIHLPKVLQPANTQFDYILKFQSYRLIKGDQRYSSLLASPIAETAKLMQEQMRPKSFDPSDSISVFNFLSNFKTTFDRIGLSKTAAVWLFQNFIRNRTTSILNGQTRLRHS